jgi:alkyl hydroperoxide reductase subunit AhpF
MAFLNPQDAEFIRTRFASELQHDVTLEFFAPSTGGLVLPGHDGETAEYTRKILEEVAGLSDKVHLNVHSVVAEPEVAQRFGIGRTPAVAFVGAEDYGIRYYGIPGGYEFATLLELIIAVSAGQAAIAESSKDVLARLKEDAHIQVFVTPT